MFVIGMAAVALASRYGTGYYYPPYLYWGPGSRLPILLSLASYIRFCRLCIQIHGRAASPGGQVLYMAPMARPGVPGWYNPATGRYGQRCQQFRDRTGARTVASAYNPWTGGYGATTQGHNAYAQWGSSAAVRGDQWVQTGHVTTARGTAFGYQGSGGQGTGFRGANGSVARTNNYTYAGNDGNVYRKDSGGNWSKYNNGGWNSVDTSAAKQKFDNAKQNGRIHRQDRTFHLAPGKG